MSRPPHIDLDALRQSVRAYLASFEDPQQRAAALADFVAELVERMRAEQGDEAAAEFARAARMMMEKMADRPARRG